MKQHYHWLLLFVTVNNPSVCRQYHRGSNLGRQHVRLIQALGPWPLGSLPTMIFWEKWCHLSCRAPVDGIWQRAVMMALGFCQTSLLVRTVTPVKPFT